MEKIFQLITSVQLGGAEMVAFDLAEHCRRVGAIGADITVVELFSTQNQYALAKKEELKAKGIRIITLFRGSKRMSLLFDPFMLIYYLRKEKPAVIHSHTDLPDFVLSVVIRLSRLMGIRVPGIVRTIHNTQLWRSHYQMGKFTEKAFKNECVVAVSSYAMTAYEQLRKKYDLSISDNRQIIYNGRLVPEKRPHPFVIDKGRINVAFCGRFEDYKGMETLLPTVREIQHRYPGGFTFHIIGDGTYRKQLEQLTREEPDVFLYDPLPNVSTLFHAFDYIFMPSHFEGLTLISIESSFAGVPVIASFAPGLDETLPENWPLKFHLDRVEELYEIFDKVYKHQYDRESLKTKALDFVGRKFSLSKMIHSYILLYQKLILNRASSIN